ncbi:hypothetical protein BaRGS_00030392, partial [Batillaria attramentaria]
MNAYVDSMVRCLQQISHNKYNVYTVEKVVKSGSLGKGTATSDSDIDLVVYFNGLHNIQDLERARPTLLNLIEAEVAQLNWRQFLGRMVLKKKTTHSVCYILYGTGIDILPAFDAQRELGSPSNIYQAMSQYHGPPAKAAQQYSASLATLQVEFVKQADNRVKEVIRRLKEWKESNGLDIRAYSLELLAIYCHQPSMSVGQLHKKCLEQLSNIENLRSSAPRFVVASLAMKQLANSCYLSSNPIAIIRSSGKRGALTQFAVQPFRMTHFAAPVGGSNSRMSYHCCESAFGGVMAFVLESGITDRFSPSVDRMVRCLHQISTPQYKVKEVIKGGSLGKGTATPESDIDLVVYFNGLNSIEHLKSARPELNQLIASHIGRHLQLSQLKQSSWFVKCTLDGIEMDIVPAFDVLAERGGAAAVYREMASYPGGRDFVKYVDSRIKDAIRDLKTWAERNGVKIASYCLELIAIHVYQPPMSKEQLFRKCMQQLASCDNLRIAFNKNYNSGNYT